MNFFDLDLSLEKEDMALKKSVQAFAKHVMRPIAKELDEMTPVQVAAQDSPFRKFMKKAFELDYHLILLPEDAGGMGLSPLQMAIVFEEMGWGSVGMTIPLVTAAVPAFLAGLAPNDQLINEIVMPFVACKDGSVTACWAITEPDHGSDTLMPGYPSFQDASIPAQCNATLEGEDWVINGQKSAWVSGGTISTHCALFCQVDPSMGHAGGGIFIVPMDLPGVKRGAPLDKIGQRDLNQGEIFFEGVRIPKAYGVITQPEVYETILESFLSFTTAFMGVISTGLARAAFEEALAYAKNRVQGGKPIIEYPNVQQQLFDMFRKVESSRYLSRAAFIYNVNALTAGGQPAEEYSIAAKTHCTQAAFEVAHEAIQIFGGNGLTKEYVIEKLFRDARATLIEDGSNDILAISGGNRVINTYPRKN
ncbi:acyl-CoA dehydrogenase family protein [Desulfocicer niacini]